MWPNAANGDSIAATAGRPIDLTTLFVGSTTWTLSSTGVQMEPLSKIGVHAWTPTATLPDAVSADTGVTLVAGAVDAGTLEAGAFVEVGAVVVPDALFELGEFEDEIATATSTAINTAPTATAAATSVFLRDASALMASPVSGSGGSGGARSGPGSAIGSVPVPVSGSAAAAAIGAGSVSGPITGSGPVASGSGSISVSM